MRDDPDGDDAYFIYHFAVFWAGGTKDYRLKSGIADTRSRRGNQYQAKV